MAPIQYGIPAIEMSYFKAKQKLFPNSSEVVLGGCVVGTATQEEVLYCTQCRTAREQWLATHTHQPRQSRRH